MSLEGLGACARARSDAVSTISPTTTILGARNDTLSVLGQVRRPRAATWNAERDVFTRVISAADRHDDVLLAVDGIGHWRAALRRRHPDRADFLAGGLFVGAQHRPAGMLWRCRHLRIAHHDERFGHHQPDTGRIRLAGFWDVEAAQRRMIANDIR